MVSVLLTAHVKRVSVSLMKNFFSSQFWFCYNLYCHNFSLSHFEFGYNLSFVPLVVLSHFEFREGDN